MTEKIKPVDGKGYEIEGHFRMITDLFKLARNSAIDTNMGQYDYFHGPADTTKVIPLPQEIAGLVPQDIPLENPHLVHYEDRRSTYYTESRGESALLSNVLEKGARMIWSLN